MSRGAAPALPPLLLLALAATAPSRTVVRADSTPRDGACAADSAGASHCEEGRQRGRGPAGEMGAGCSPIADRGGELEWDEFIDVQALPKKARVFVCYDSRSPSDYGDTGFNPARGGVLVVEGFLNKKEVKHMRSLTEQWTAGAQDQGGFVMAYGAGKQYRDDFDLGDAREKYPWTYGAFDDGVLNRIESRIAGFLQIPATHYENHLQLMLIEPSSKKPTVHHDKNNALVRLATALVYLSGEGTTAAEESLLGGETLFPALIRSMPGSAVTASGQQTQHSKSLKNMASQALRRLKPGDAWPEMHISTGHPLHDELIELCHNASQSQVLAIAPRPGRAVFWWHEGSTSKDSPPQDMSNMWHVGCPVREGRKLSVQKFKNFGPDNPNCKQFRWCGEAWKRMVESVTVNSKGSTG